MGNREGFKRGFDDKHVYLRGKMLSLSLEHDKGWGAKENLQKYQEKKILVSNFSLNNMIIGHYANQ